MENEECKLPTLVDAHGAGIWRRMTLQRTFER
jgi:hypothetical protein